jgi:hypothetical protein
MKETIYTFFTRHFDALLASIIACLFIYYNTLHSGIGISPDSVTYFATAENIQHHFSFIDFTGLPTVDFPLGYPILLALIAKLSGFTVLQIAPVLNGFLYTGVVFLTSIILHGFRERSIWYKLFFLFAIVFSPCLIEVYSMLWSETLFLFLCLLFIVLFRRYQETHSDGPLILASIIAALAFFTRYAGITILATGFGLILFDGSINTKKKIKHLIGFVTISSSLLLFNLYRNAQVAGHLTGVREKAIRTLTDNFYQIGNTLSDWFPFIKGHESIATLVFILILLWAVLLSLFRMLQQQFYKSYEQILACFVVVFSAFMLIISTISRFESLSSRLLSPMYIPLLIVATSWIVPVIRSLNKSKRFILFIPIFFFYASFQLNQYQQNAAAWEGIKDAGMPGYTEASWTHAEIIQYVRTNKASYPSVIYADAPDALFFLTGLVGRSLPHKELDMEKNELLKTNSFYLIWFDDGENDDLVNKEYIFQHYNIVSQKLLNDGAVYQLIKK